jgi:CubicO group peptidase (beta-lactamase class C family)
MIGENASLRSILFLGVALLFTGACVRPDGVTATAGGPASDRNSAQLVDSSSAVALRVDRYLTGLEAMGFSGGIIVEHQGDVVLRKGYGLADREARRRYGPEIVHDILSINKSFTAAAILLLESRGLLRTDDPISRFFDDVPVDKETITLHHLLTHQSGWPSVIGPDDEPIGAEAFVSRAMRTPLEFEAGAGVTYSNVAYSLLGIVVERLSGRGYEEFLREELLLPLGMENTGYVLADWPDDAIALGYRDDVLFGRTVDQGWMADGPGWNLRAAGGLHSTLNDMHRWLQLLRGRGPLDAGQIERWTTAKVELSGGAGYAYGWQVEESDYGRVIAHNGGNPALSSDFVWLPEQNFFFYITGNTSFQGLDSILNGSRLRQQLLRAAYDSDLMFPPLLSADRDADPTKAGARADEYVLTSGSITLTADDSRLVAVLDGQDALDAMLGPDAAERELLSDRNERAESVIRRLEARRNDVHDAVSLPAALIETVDLEGELRSARLIGSVTNVPGSRAGRHGGISTLLRLEYANGRELLLGLRWRDDGSFHSVELAYRGLVPQFVLVPTERGAYTAIESAAPWRTRLVTFEQDCMVVGGYRACRHGRELEIADEMNTQRS